MKALTNKEINIKITNIDKWKIIDGSLCKEFEFENFVKAIEIVHLVRK